MNKSAPNPLLVCTAVSLAAFMEILDTTIANVALTHIAGDLGAGTEESTWILTSYLVTNAIVLPLSGWLSERIGRKKFFLLSIVGFTLCSFLCGIANSLTILIVFRLLQGITGGGLQPSQQAIIKDSFPPDKLGMAFAITGISTVFAPILGPALGGYITDEFSWRWIFFVNIPIGILAAILVKKYVHDVKKTVEAKEKGIDIIGIGLLALGLGALQITLDNGEQYDWFDNAYICLFMGIAALALVLAVCWMLYYKKPVLNLKLFAVPSFSIACIMIFFIGAFVNVTVMLMPMLVQNCYGYNAKTAGMILVPGGAMMLFLLPITGRLTEKVQLKYIVAAGLFLCSISMWFAAGITPQTDESTFIFLRILQTLGVPFLFVPVTSLAFSKIPMKDSNNASAITVLMKNIGGSFGISLVVSYLVHRQQINQSYLSSHLVTDAVGFQTAAEHGLRYMSQQMVDAKIYIVMQQQSAILAYIDIFLLLAEIFIVLAILAMILLPKNKTSK